MQKGVSSPKKIYFSAIAVLGVLLISIFASFHRFNALANASS